VSLHNKHMPGHGLSKMYQDEVPLMVAGQ